MMKKILTAVLAAVMVMSFTVGCSKKNEDNTNTIKDGKKLNDVITAIDNKFKEKYGEDFGAVMMPMEIDDQYITDFVGLSSSDIQEKAGNLAMSMTNSDILLAVKAKEGKIDTVKQALEKRKTDLEAQYETYNVMGSYDRAKAGEVYVKGDYAFLIVVGPGPEGDEAPAFDKDVAMTKEVIDSMFN